MSDMSSLGLFSQPSYLTINDTYDKKQDDKQRHKGKQFLTNPSKKGKVGQSVTFDSFKPLYEKDTYADPGTHEKTYIKEQKKKQITPQPFKPSSPPKKSTTLGGLYGAIGKLPEHLTEYEVVKKGEHKRGKIAHERKNITTSPSKRGTYGFCKTTIGEVPEYQPDPYDLAKEKTLKEQAEKKKLQTAPHPFKAMSVNREFFDVSSDKVPASKIYTDDDKVLKPKPVAPPSPKKDMKPFRPSSPPKKGLNSTLNPFPTYKEDPYEKKVLKKDPNRKSAPVFKPVSSGKSKPTRSIIFGGLNATL